eukprot:SAG11_NODE_6464_length_1308_cov_1.589744_1_plen_262_part_00
MAGWTGPRPPLRRAPHPRSAQTTRLLRLKLLAQYALPHVCIAAQRPPPGGVWHAPGPSDDQSMSAAVGAGRWRRLPERQHRHPLLRLALRKPLQAPNALRPGLPMRPPLRRSRLCAAASAAAALRLHPPDAEGVSGEVRAGLFNVEQDESEHTDLADLVGLSCGQAPPSSTLPVGGWPPSVESGGSDLRRVLRWVARGTGLLSCACRSPRSRQSCWRGCVRTIARAITRRAAPCKLRRAPRRWASTAAFGGRGSPRNDRSH